MARIEAIRFPEVFPPSRVFTELSAKDRREINTARYADLIDLVVKGDVAKLSESIQADRSLITFENGYNQNLLHLSIIRKDLPMLTHLLTLGVSIHSDNKLWDTPLHYAVMEGDLEMVKVLVDAGSDMHALSKDGCSPLGLAVVYSHLPILRYLLKKKADPNQRLQLGLTALHLAVQRNHREAVGPLLSRGASTEIRPGANEDMSDVLSVACLCCDADVVSQLLRSGSRCDMVDTEGNTCLHNAARVNNAPVASLLLERGVSVDQINESGQTPLHIAAEFGHEEVAKALLGGNANPLIRDNSENTPNELASAHGFVSLAEDLGACTDSHQRLTKTLIDSPVPQNQQSLDAPVQLDQPIGTVISQVTSLTLSEASPSLKHVADGQDNAQTALPLSGSSYDFHPHSSWRADPVPWLCTVADIPLSDFDTLLSCDQAVAQRESEIESRQGTLETSQLAQLELELLLLLWLRYHVHGVALPPHVSDLARKVNLSSTLDSRPRSTAIYLYSLVQLQDQLRDLSSMTPATTASYPGLLVDLHYAYYIFPSWCSLRRNLGSMMLILTALVASNRYTALLKNATISVLIDTFPPEQHPPVRTTAQIMTPMKLLLERASIQQSEEDFYLYKAYLSKIPLVEAPVIGGLPVLIELSLDVLRYTKDIKDAVSVRSAIAALPEDSFETLEYWRRLGEIIAHIFDETENAAHLFEANTYYMKAYAGMLQIGTWPKEPTEQVQHLFQQTVWVLVNRVIFDCDHPGRRRRSELCESCFQDSCRINGLAGDLLHKSELIGLWNEWLGLATELGSHKCLAVATYFARRRALHAGNDEEVSEALAGLASVRKLWHDREHTFTDLNDAIELLGESMRRGDYSMTELLESNITLADWLQGRFILSNDYCDLDTALSLCKAVELHALEDSASPVMSSCLIAELKMYLSRYFAPRSTQEYEQDRNTAESILRRLRERESSLSREQKATVSLFAASMSHDSKHTTRLLLESRNVFQEADVPLKTQAIEFWALGSMFARNEDNVEAWATFNLAFDRISQLQLNTMPFNDLERLYEKFANMTDLAGHILLSLGNSIESVIQQTEPLQTLSTELRGFKERKEAATSEDILEEAQKAHLADRGQPACAPSLTSISDQVNIWDLAAQRTVIGYFAGYKTTKVVILHDSRATELELATLDITTIERNASLLVGDGRLSKGDGRTRSSRNADLLRLLRWLWLSAVKPVLAHLGYLDRRGKLEDPPRVVWIAQGLMSLMPLHAAGDFEHNTAQCAADYVVSTYSCSYASLYHSLKRAGGNLDTTSVRATAFSFNDDTNTRRNLDVEKELAAFYRCFPSSMPSSAPSSSAEDILGRLKDCNTLHWASHGLTNMHQPDSSGLALGRIGPGGEDDVLTLLDIQGIRVQDGLLAYLSACMTAAHPSRFLVSENMHLAAAFEKAGFAQVVANMWEVDDDAAQFVAVEFYRQLSKSRPVRITGETVARSLHAAVEALRAGPGSRQRDVLAWVPFVHFGS